ncbi:MAG: Eco57I restriction-modification methylase domain-containing protein [Anaerolineae bacterium]|nr:Eco57I restriction-modification methylase domain-containing protein [Anaerolineae bacterium]
MHHQTKFDIQRALAAFTDDDLRANARGLFAALGYESDRQLDLTPATAAGFVETFGLEGKLDPERTLLDRWQQVEVIFQLTTEEVIRSAQIRLFDAARVDNTIIESYLFLAISLSPEISAPAPGTPVLGTSARERAYTRAQLAQITREVNKQFAMPVLILFQHGNTLTLSVIDRRLHKRDAGQDVLEKVTLIKDIRFAAPHRAHIEILFDLSLVQLLARYDCKNFVDLHRAWKQTLDSSELNKRFFKEIANWYFWAVDNVTYPEGGGADPALRNATAVIRLLTRLIFVWFIKEKGLVPEDLFNKRKVDTLLTYSDPDDSTYYKAILQNLFFATLNQEMNTPEHPGNRKFRGRASHKGGRDPHYGVHNVYRYERYFADPARALALFATIPFLNGGLFECLDGPDPADERKTLRVDGFSDRSDNPLRVPDFLFFSEAHDVDLNATYGTRDKGYSVRGLIDILSSYKFTIDENTPIEEEIALDPELLGKVFENLLAAYNPETETTARKQTGSFYTPREIVNYMVDEALIAYLQTRVVGDDARDASPVIRHVLSVTQPPSTFPIRLRQLFAYTDDIPAFSDAETDALVAAIDDVKILDPAVGSGAFPMGILHKLVFILGKLDPGNARWKARQREREIAPLLRDIQTARKISFEEAREQAVAQLEARLREIEESFARNEMDYARKLYLIENCLYGVDIQPVAVQIAKLRCFISLVVDQTVDETQSNRGILPLPNLETKFVAANTLLGLDRPQQLMLRNADIDVKEAELADTRHKLFRARTPATKRKYRERDQALRAELSDLLLRDGFARETTEKLAQWDPHSQNVSADFFDPEWMFGLTEGFDVVIGNPPYVRHERIREYKPALQQQHPEVYQGTADLYVYFYAQGIKVLRPHGHLAFITSNKFMRAGYGKALRQFLAKATTPRLLIDFGDLPVFDATAYPCVLMTQKTPAPAGNIVNALTVETEEQIAHISAVMAQHAWPMPQKRALTADGWRLEPPGVLALLEKLRKAGTPLGEYVGGRFYRGILTGYNEAFVIDRATRDRLIAEHPSSAEVIRPFLRGRDVKRWVVDFAEQYLIKIESSQNVTHPWSGKSDADAEKIFAQTYPAIHAHFEPHRKQLVKRYDQGAYFWELRACAYWEEFEYEQIVWGNLATQPQFSFTEPGTYLCAPANTIVSDSEYLLGILNSSLTQYLIAQSAAERAGGFLEYKPMYISPLPIPDKPQNETISSLVTRILDTKHIDPNADVSALEAEIDRQVYALYGLTEEEIAVVEGIC